MSVDRIVCLANSYKHDHRCVAGISIQSRKWVRLVGQIVTGCLTVEETRYASGGETRILDLIEVELGAPCPSNCHPEDQFIENRRFRPIRRFDQTSDREFLNSYLGKSEEILGSCGDRVYARKFEDRKAPRSLELVRADDLWWWIREESGKRKHRALFRCGQVSRARYDLAVTDPVWLECLHRFEPGVYPHDAVLGRKSKRTLLTVSLSEPFEKFHYKLVAGVVALDA